MKRRWRFPTGAFLTALVILTGVGVVSYPSTASWWSQYYQSQAISTYRQAVADDAPPGAKVHLARAREYNRLLATGAVHLGGDYNKPAFDADEDSDSGAELDYWQLLPTEDDTMARLRIPSIDVDLPVYHGTEDETLLKGVGHLEGTSLPVGGKDTHSVLTAHRGLATSTLFDDLHHLRVGDRFSVDVMGETLTYQVNETHTVLPNETELIELRKGEDLLTLVTCTPLGINTHRYLVTGERVFPTPEEDIDAGLNDPDIPRFPWWAVIYGASVAAAAFYVWREGLTQPQAAAKGPSDHIQVEAKEGGSSQAEE